jgi:hypothetical protein
MTTQPSTPISHFSSLLPPTLLPPLQEPSAPDISARSPDISMQPSPRSPSGDRRLNCFREEGEEEEEDGGRGWAPYLWERYEGHQREGEERDNRSERSGEGQEHQMSGELEGLELSLHRSPLLLRSSPARPASRGSGSQSLRGSPATASKVSISRVEGVGGRGAGGGREWTEPSTSGFLSDSERKSPGQQHHQNTLSPPSLLSESRG